MKNIHLKKSKTAGRHFIFHEFNGVIFIIKPN